MANFPSIEPSFSVTKRSQPRIKVVQFADGFEHRLGFGLPNHQDPKTYNLKTINEQPSDYYKINSDINIVADPGLLELIPGQK